MFVSDIQHGQKGYNSNNHDDDNNDTDNYNDNHTNNSISNNNIEKLDNRVSHVKTPKSHHRDKTCVREHKLKAHYQAKIYLIAKF